MSPAQAKLVDDELSAMYAMALEVEHLLAHRDIDKVLESLRQREKQLQLLRQDVNKADLAALAGSADHAALRKKVEKIQKLDEKNLIALKSLMQDAFDDILEVGKERQSIKDMRSIAAIGKRKIVDFRF